MNVFEIQKINHSKYKALIFSTSYDSPINYLTEVLDKIKLYNEQRFFVIFDTLLSLGNNSNRFIEAFFDGQKFDNKSFRYVNIDRSDDIYIYSSLFYKKNSEILNNSILNSYQKKIVINNISL